MLTELEAIAFVSGLMCNDFDGPDLAAFKAAREGDAILVDTGTARGPFLVMREAWGYHYIIKE